MSGGRFGAAPGSAEGLLGALVTAEAGQLGEALAAIGATEPADRHWKLSRIEVAGSKLTRPPPRPGIVARTRLVERLLASDGVPVVCVVAPAGYGKTILLGQWAQRTQCRVGWVSLDQRDNDPAVLLTYLGVALDRIERSGPRVVILPTVVAARHGAGLAGHTPGPPGSAAPPGQGGIRPLPLEVLLDAVGAVLLDGLGSASPTAASSPLSTSSAAGLER